LYRDPGVRNYLFAGLAGLALIFVILFQNGSLEGGLIILLIGAGGLLLRWVAAPPFLLLVLVYFLAFPYGIPDPGPPSAAELVYGRFRVADMMLTAAVVVYLGAQYRLFGLTQQALPQDVGVVQKRGVPPERRPARLIAANEIPRSLWVAGGVVLAGQFVWFLVTGLQVAAGDTIPLRYAEPSRFLSRSGPGTLIPPAQRFVILTGMIVFTALLARLVFGYWRLRVMKPDEAGMVLQDAGWDESRRELTRVESWRRWGRERAERRERERAKCARRATKGD
jgi:hypothetical protein